MLKVAVFKEQDKICIASSKYKCRQNKSKNNNGSYLKIFLESDIGTKLLQSIQRGSTIVNINYQDINMLEVPTPSLEEQNEIVTKYNSALENYISIITKAEKEWNKNKR